MRYNIHTHLISNEPDTRGILNCYPDDALPNGCFSMGIHPWYIEMKEVQRQLVLIKAALDNPNCLALGECGLDKRIEVAMEQQLVVFQKQLEMAQSAGKPVILHCVGAFQEVLQLKKQMRLTIPIVVHGFSKSVELAQQLLASGFYLSFGKKMLNQDNIKTVMKAVPLNRLFLETDTVDVPLVDVYEAAARALQIERETLENQITINFNQVFCIHEKVDRTC